MNRTLIRAAALTGLALALSLSACQPDPILQSTLNAGNTQAALTSAAGTFTATSAASPTTFASPTLTAEPATSTPTPTSSIVEVTPCGQAICEIDTPIPTATSTAMPTETASASPTHTATPTSTSSPSATPTHTAVPTITPSPSAAPTNTPTAAQPSGPSAGCPNAPFAVGGRWNRILCDGFDGTSLDTSVWQPNWFGATLTSVTQFVNSTERQCFDPAQLTVAGGELDIAAIHQTCPSTAGASAGFSTTSGIISSYPRFTFTYGLAEIRMWVTGPDENHCHNWDSFWLNGEPAGPSAVGGSGREEYDVAECLGGSFDFHLNPGSVFGGSSSGPISNGWHVFSIDWEPSGATVYYDHTKIGTIAQRVYAAPMYLIVENAIHDSGTVVVPDTMRIDTIAVWQMAS